MNYLNKKTIVFLYFIIFGVFQNQFLTAGTNQISTTFQLSGQKQQKLSADSAKAKKQVEYRNENLEDFTKSVSDFKDGAKERLAKRTFRLWGKEKWKKLERVFKNKKLNGGWPPNAGFISKKGRIIKTGELKLDRYGGRIENGKFTDTGRFFAIDGSSFESRALPESTKNSLYHQYYILKDLPVIEGEAIPWFGQKGMGIQFQTVDNVNTLIEQGYIKLIE